MSITQYYATSNWTSRWGVVDADHPTPHKGLDIYHPGGTVIPVLRSGTIVADSPSASVGRYITVQVATGDFDTYCHVVSYGLGGHVTAESPLAVVAGYGDPHGTAWTGPHTHFCNSSTVGGWAYWGPENRNPEPVIISVLTSIAGGGVTPLPDQKEDDMAIYERGVNTGVFGLGGFGGFVDIDNSKIPNVRAVLTQAFGAPIQQFPADYDAVRALLLSTKPAPASGGATADAIAAAVDAKLADDFAKVNKNIDDQPTKFTVTPQ